MRTTAGLRALVAVVVVGLASGIAVGAVVARGTFDDASSKDAVANPDQVTPASFPGYPATVEVPDYANPPECQLPADERPSPDAPPLSCRNTGAEPPAGAIPTAPAESRPDTSKPPAGSRILDNALLRFTVTIPEEWYSDMRPEGGAFSIYDPAAVTAAGKTGSGMGGLILIFTATRYLPPSDPNLAGPIEQHLAAPNLKLGAFDAASWDEGPGEGLAHFVHTVFIREGVLYSIDAYIAGGDRPAGTIAADLQRAADVVATVAPY